MYATEIHSGDWVVVGTDLFTTVATADVYQGVAVELATGEELNLGRYDEVSHPNVRIHVDGFGPCYARIVRPVVGDDVDQLLERRNRLARATRHMKAEEFATSPRVSAVIEASLRVCVALKVAGHEVPGVLVG